MATGNPKDELAPGILSGEFVPLTASQFVTVFMTAAHVLGGGVLPPVLEVAADRKYRGYADWEKCKVHAGLLAAICNVRGSLKTTRVALRTAFAAEFTRRLDSEPGESRAQVVPVAAPMVRH